MSPLWPWPTIAASLECQVTGIVVDGGRRVAPPDPDLVVLGDDLGHWHGAVIDTGLAVSAEDWPADLDASSVDATFVVVSQSTNTSVGTVLQRGKDQRSWSGPATIAVDSIGESARGWIELTTEIGGSPRVVGRSNAIRLVGRKPEALVLAGPSGLDWEWFDFSKPQDSKERQHLSDTPGLPFFVDFSGSNPVLCLNEAIPGFRATMEDGPASSAERALAELLGAQVAAGTASALALHALSSSGLEDDVVSPPPSLALMDALRAAASLMTGIDDAEGLIRAYHAHLEEGKTESAALIASRAAMAAATMAQLGVAVENAAMQARRGAA